MTFVWQYPRWKYKRKKRERNEFLSNPFWISRWGFFSNHYIIFRNQVNIIKQALKITGCQPLEAAPLCRDSRLSLISRPPTLLSLLLLCSNRLLCYRWSAKHYSTIPVFQNFLKPYHSGYPLPSRGLSEQFYCQICWAKSEKIRVFYLPGQLNNYHCLSVSRSQLTIRNAIETNTSVVKVRNTLDKTIRAYRWSKSDPRH